MLRVWSVKIHTKLLGIISQTLQNYASELFESDVFFIQRNDLQCLTEPTFVVSKGQLVIT